MNNTLFNGDIIKITVNSPGKECICEYREIVNDNKEYREKYFYPKIERRTKSFWDITAQYEIPWDFNRISYNTYQIGDFVILKDKFNNIRSNSIGRIVKKIGVPDEFLVVDFCIDCASNTFSSLDETNVEKLPTYDYCSIFYISSKDLILMKLKK